jgi:hypothetical protein
VIPAVGVLVRSSCPTSRAHLDVQVPSDTAQLGQGHAPGQVGRQHQRHAFPDARDVGPGCLAPGQEDADPIVVPLGVSYLGNPGAVIGLGLAATVPGMTNLQTFRRHCNCWVFRL